MFTFSFSRADFESSKVGAMHARAFEYVPDDLFTRRRTTYAALLKEKLQETCLFCAPNFIEP